MNSFGFGGANAHVVLKSNPRGKQNTFPSENIPRLITVSGRNENAADSLLSHVEKNPHDPEFYALLSKIHKHHIVGHNFRGFTVLGNPSLREVSVSLIHIFITIFNLFIYKSTSTTYFAAIHWGKKANLVCVLWNGIPMARYGKRYDENSSVQTNY